MKREEFVNLVKTYKDSIVRIANESAITGRDILRKFLEQVLDEKLLKCCYRYLSGYLLCVLQPKSIRVVHDVQDNMATLTIGTREKKSPVYEQAVLYTWADDELDSMEKAKEAFTISLKNEGLDFIAESYWELVELKF